MRKKTVVLMPIMMMLMMMVSGCGEAVGEGEPDKAVSVSSPTVSDILKERISEEASLGDDSGTVADNSEVQQGAEATGSAAAVPKPEKISEDAVLSTIEGVDIDLTSLSSTFVYSQVYNMMFYPENFIGKTIRMEGMYSDYFDQDTGKHYFGCIIQDATACCAQGVEFEPGDNYSYPDDYPEEGDDVVVEGVFDIYEEDGQNYCTLRNAEFIE